MKNKHFAGIIIMALTFTSLSCGISRKKEQEKPKEVLPKIETLKDVADNDNKRVMIEGIYTQIDIRLKKENPAVKYTGQVAIKLQDNTNVFIYPPTSPESIRPKKEIKEMQDQQVRIVGMIFKNMPQSDLVKSKLPPAIQSSPYITYVEKIELVNPLPPKKSKRVTTK
ncbi:MAG: hypothetical protein BWY70_00587 [Bacteroidetes bacterium ADurb.Bin408]|nr:MAG: hypothetical protein BWY70_00587 [Bacteroidetes bacterium ADurb.Bin408]